MTGRWADLFARLDEPKCAEHPAGFAREREEQSAARFAAELRLRLGGEVGLKSGASIQDASFHSEIRFGPSVYGSLRFSSFGRMIAWTPDAEVPDRIRSEVERLAAEQRFTLVPTDELEVAYPRAIDGRETIRTWWIRYFDHL